MLCDLRKLLGPEGLLGTVRDRRNYHSFRFGFGNSATGSPSTRTYRQKRPRTGGQRTCWRTRRPAAAAASAARRWAEPRTVGPPVPEARLVPAVVRPRLRLLSRRPRRRHIFGTTPMLTGPVATCASMGGGKTVDLGIRPGPTEHRVSGNRSRNADGTYRKKAVRCFFFFFRTILDGRTRRTAPRTRRNAIVTRRAGITSIYNIMCYGALSRACNASANLYRYYFILITHVATGGGKSRALGDGAVRRQTTAEVAGRGERRPTARAFAIVVWHNAREFFLGRVSAVSRYSRCTYYFFRRDYRVHCTSSASSRRVVSSRHSDVPSGQRIVFLFFRFFSHCETGESHENYTFIISTVWVHY